MYIHTPLWRVSLFPETVCFPLFCSSLLTCFVCLLTERKYSAPAHHTTEHVPEKKFKSEALLSTLTSDASKENTPGKTHILTALESPYKNMSGTNIHSLLTFFREHKHFQLVDQYYFNICKTVQMCFLMFLKECLPRLHFLFIKNIEQTVIL